MSSASLATLAHDGFVDFFEINLFLLMAHAWLAELPVGDKVRDAILNSCMIAAAVCEFGSR